MVSWTGHPPVEGTVQRLFRPLMLETKTICLPSGDQSDEPMARVMYSFSMEKTLGSKVAMFFDSSFLGSVTAGGGVSVWARSVELMSKKITEKTGAGPDRDIGSPFGCGERINESGGSW